MGIDHWTESSDLLELSYDVKRPDLLNSSRLVMDHLERAYGDLHLWFGVDPVRELGVNKIRVVLYGDEQFDREFSVQQRGSNQSVFEDDRLRRWASQAIRAEDSLILRRRRGSWSEFRLEVYRWPTPEDIVDAAEAMGLILRSQGDHSIGLAPP